MLNVNQNSGKDVLNVIESEILIMDNIINKNPVLWDNLVNNWIIIKTEGMQSYLIPTKTYTY